MKIEVLNGGGFSRVTPQQNQSSLGGFSRVNKSATDTYLSGFRLNSTDNYILSGRKERREERKEKRQERREDRKEARQERREDRKGRREDRKERKKERKDVRSRRREARAQRSEKRSREGGFLDRLLETGKEVWKDIKPSLIDKVVPPAYQDLAYDMLDSGMKGEDIRDRVLDYMEEDGYSEDGYSEEDIEQKGLFRKKSWWEKQEPLTKGLIIGGGVLALDIALKGPISTNVLGMKKKKSK